MEQSGLIDCVIETLGLNSCISTPKWTLAEGTPLVRDEDGELLHGNFSYSSVITMLLYLSRHTRPDISYTVNCCTRYMFNPCHSHEIALKRISRYLKATRDKGLVLNPCKKLRVDCFPNADLQVSKVIRKLLILCVQRA